VILGTFTLTSMAAVSLFQPIYHVIEYLRILRTFRNGADCSNATSLNLSNGIHDRVIP
jgi:hypothetical protein